ncbi:MULTISPECIES: YitT family protein [unclassified Sporolactobacillus]|uniref:YitT family protein n=1 Tax=unclassified Sporolactobacillus TaxID=2628533 RepID=UPI0023683CD2|nr:YitT family protein [Sporolactobacillus sp. CQH2019]MDD9148079.1 YitT family protein [Sporolactobacillus sp. CQH2019]
MDFLWKRDKHAAVSRGRIAAVSDYLYVLIGSAIVGIAFNVFQLPNRIAAGGVSGISIILHWTLGWEPSFVIWAINIPLYIGGVLILGKSFGYLDYALKTLLGTLFLPLSVFLTADWPPATNNPLLGALFGGIGVGLGLGIVFRGRGSTGGTALAGQVIQRFSGLSIGLCVSVIDGLIVLSSAFFISLESALYALISIYLQAKVIDVVQIGFNTEKLALIISDKEDELRRSILQEIDRGVTRIISQGGFTGDNRPMLMTVVSRDELTHLKQLVHSVDPESFFIIANATEVFGKGFYKRR